MRDGDGVVSCCPLWMMSRVEYQYYTRVPYCTTPPKRFGRRQLARLNLLLLFVENPCWCVSLTFASVSSLSCCSCRNLFRIARAKCSKKLFCFLMSVSLVHFRWKSVFRSRVFRAPNVGCFRCSLCFPVVLILCGCSSLKMFSQFSFTR